MIIQPAGIAKSIIRKIKVPVSQKIYDELSNNIYSESNHYIFPICNSVLHSVFRKKEYFS